MPPCTYLGVLLAAIVLSSLPPTPVVKFDFQKECLALGTLVFYMLPEQATFAKSLSPLTSSLASSWLLKTSKESGSWLTKTVATTDLTAYFASVSIRGLDAIDCLAFVVVLEFALLLLRIVNASRKSLKSSTREVVGRGQSLRPALVCGSVSVTSQVYEPQRVHISEMQHCRLLGPFTTGRAILVPPQALPLGPVVQGRAPTMVRTH
ncbi:hypothetical protein WJX79_008482 [Trebouxia sp. C0005]